MLLNLGLNRLAPSLDPSLRKAPNIVAAPQSNIDVNAILGLAPSKYSGLQSVGNTGYYYGDNKMYEPYTPSSSYGMRSHPIFGYSYSPHPILGHSVSPHPIFGYSHGAGGAVSGTITRDGQSFKPVDVDITGFSKNKIGDTDTYEYTPSMAYVYSQAPKPTYAPTPNVTSFLNTPTIPSYAGNYGAGRFLGNTGGGLLNFSAPQITATTQGTK